MKNRVLLPLLAVFAAGCAAAEKHPHWSYAGAEDPAHWGGLAKEYEACRSGANQSPVDFAAAAPIKGNSVHYRYAAQTYKLENNGHTLQAVAQGRPQYAYIGGKTFTLKQFHFHTPSEHTFKGKYFPMEAHFVHQGAKGELAVLGVVFKEGKDNPALAPLVAEKLKAGKSRMPAQPLDINALLPKNRAHFRLNGSLTTPPCSEGVNWVVFETPVEAGRAQIKAMEDIIGQKNNRPVQPLNARIVVEEK